MKIELGELEVDIVQEQLRLAGINSQNWRNDHLRFLAVPYHLALFMRHVNEAGVPGAVRAEEGIFNSIREIHEARWQLLHNKETASDRTKLLTTFAQEIRRTELLWQDPRQLNLDHDETQALVGSGWLREQEGKIGFAHQTQYEFVIGR